MTSLVFGLIAALCWGVHDFLVRNVSQAAATAPLLFTTLAVGSVLLIPLSLDQMHMMTAQAFGLAGLSGVAYMAGCFGLYRAFAIGPVRLVAPICGAFPVISVLIAVAQGRALSVIEGVAVLAVVGGIALVARQSSSENTSSDSPNSVAIGWAVLGAVGFAATFGFGQAAARLGSELPATLVSRVVAMALVGALMVLQGASLAGVRRKLPLLCVMGALDVTALTMVLIAGIAPNPEYAAVASSIFGIITILLAWRFDGEGMRPVQWFGVAVVFGGIARLALG